MKIRHYILDEERRVKAVADVIVKQEAVGDANMGYVDENHRRDGGKDMKTKKVKKHRPRSVVHALGNWFVTDWRSKRVLCMCSRSRDAWRIAKLLNP